MLYTHKLVLWNNRSYLIKPILFHDIEI